MAKLLLIPARRANEGEVFTFISSFEIGLEMILFLGKSPKLNGRANLSS